MFEKYLEYRFKFNNRNAYHHYFEEWVKNLTVDQLSYFEREMNNLISRGISCTDFLVESCMIPTSHLLPV